MYLAVDIMLHILRDPVHDSVWVRSGYTNEFNGGQVAIAWKQGVKVVCICDVVQIFETCGVYIIYPHLYYIT
jgi:hypothetical protein